ncbi:MAG: hypothetical protein ACJ77Z_13880 [Thermoleophilaceae bacterium]
MTAAKRLATPWAADVRLGADGYPVAIGAARVESVLEDWLVEDRWWSERPVRRRYLELVLEDGRCVLVFRDLVSGRWFSQRG